MVTKHQHAGSQEYHKATMNLRINSGKPVYEGEQVQIGGDESYYPVCRFHYFHPDKQR